MRVLKETAICIASGPSLTQADVDFCNGRGRVYVVKETALAAPWAHVLYAADQDWWDDNPTRWKDFQGEKWTCSGDAARKHGINHIGAKPELQWSNTPGIVATGGNSGFQIINLAVQQMPDLKRIILLGYDFGYDPNVNEKHWWEKKHPRKSRESNYAGWCKRMADAAPHIPVPVFNASVLSAITCFPRVDLREVLQ